MYYMGGPDPHARRGSFEILRVSDQLKNIVKCRILGVG